MSPVTTSDPDIFDLDLELVLETSADQPQGNASRFATQDACGTCTPTWNAGAAPGRCP